MRLWRIAGITVAAAALAYFLYQPWRGYHENSPFFITFIAGAMVMRSGSACLYCPEQITAGASQYLGSLLPPGTRFPYNYPPPVAIFFEPLSYLSPHTAYAVYAAISFIVLTLSAWLLYRYVLPEDWRPLDKAIVVTLAMTTVGSGIGLRDGALDPFLLIALVGAMLARRRGRSFLAGMFLAVLLAKPQTIWLVPPALVLAREWRFLTGLICGGLAWLLASIALVSPSAILDWIRTSDNSSSEISLGLPGVVGRITGNTHYWIWMVVICGVVAVATFWKFRERFREQPEVAMAIAVAASLALSPHLWEYDMVLATFSLCLWARTRPAYAVVTALLMSLLFTVNRSQGWEDDLVWLPEAFIAWGLLVRLRATPRATDSSPPHASLAEYPVAP